MISAAGGITEFLQASDRLALVLLALPALVAYLIRTARTALEPGFHFGLFQSFWSESSTLTIE
jgi:hypothetical protein